MPKLSTKPSVEDQFLAQVDSRLDKMSGSPPHVMIKALAGTGKTSTLIGWTMIHAGLKPKIEPSPQQKVIWDCLSLTEPGTSVRLVAFNKSIADELTLRLPKVDGIDASTCHSFGSRLVRQHFGNLTCTRKTGKERIYDALGLPFDEIREKKATVVEAVEDLVSMVKCNLCGWDNVSKTLLPFTETDQWASIFDKLCDTYEIMCGEHESEIYSLTLTVLKMSFNPLKDKRMTFDDMVWLPTVKNLTVPKVGVVLGDEMQDFNRMQQVLVMNMGHRVVVVGDENQAIYGFAGADIGGVGRLEKELNSTPRGLMVLPLTVTRRCSQAVVKEARKYVPEFEAHPSNSQGQVLTKNYLAANVPDQLKDEKWFAPMVEVGDRVICRSNAPLVGAAFMLIKLGKRVQILGRSIGYGLLKIIRDLKPADVNDLILKIGEWHQVQCTKERAKRIPSDTKLQGFTDRRDCIIFFCDNAKSTGEAGIEEVTAKIKDMFDDDEKHQTVIMSSVHKAKGLEANRVFILKPNTGKKPKKAWQTHEERCIGWVSVTRAIDTLVFVNWPEKKGQSQLAYEEDN